ncbi:MAG: LPS export ABC transporter permease LptG [Candidatus Andeanibacterium colombiense]|uniref:LPS export ABC transporter permease LptG n=1 Tax=Candidatus Andeanibacterium colombiense TaxID=3121345 RepID=A0AAJ6BR56_9SPHN|nr:MAG: LPS export ABC transporter permease LptG [Sphingomonadaceae bacterium]
MQFDFFPSRSLTIYLAKTFIIRILAVLLMLVLILQMLDLLGESGKVLGYPGNGEEQLWHYVGLRFPQLIARFLPYSVLLATIITLATLNQNSEVVAMKAAGMSAHQVLAPLLLSAGLLSGLSFVFNERIVTRASATLEAWQDVDYGKIPVDSGVRSNVYLTDGSDILSAASISGRDRAMVMEGVTFYTRDQHQMISREIHSPRATYAAPGWLLEAPVQFDVQSATTTKLQPLVLGKDITPTQVALSKVDADGENVFELRHSIHLLDAAGRRTAELKGKWWHKFSGPLSAMLMPLLGAVAAFGLARSGQLLIRAVIGMALGFAYFVVDNAALAMGNFGGYPPLLAAWAPFLLFFLIGETVLIRTEE